MTDLRPWPKVACPHADISDGSFDESLFAADLGLVELGRGPADYCDPTLFAAKTYLTVPLRAALVEIGNRLAGDSSAAAVYRMQTEFGGGKTHTLLAAYHLYGSPDKVGGTTLGRQVAAALNGRALSKARVAVLDGSALNVDPDPMPDGTVIHSFLGHLAWRLGGAPMYAKIRAKDEGRRGTSTIEIVRLLEEAAPCLILLDETLEYLNKALSMPVGDGNLAATTLTVIKELCTAAANVPGAAIVATLTSSRLEDYSTLAGEEMAERLSKVVGRTENIVTPVEGDDIFPILHTRLFETVGDQADRQAVADAYGAYYEQMGDVVPQTYRDPSYRTRIAGSYPFHPELIDVLTNRWGSLSGFQRTRGALRTLAHTVKALSRRDHTGVLIGCGDVPLDDAGVRGEIIRFAGESYKSALNADIIRADSKSVEEDRRRGGDVARHRVAVGLATSAFLHSFGSDRVLGASSAQMLVGAGHPGISRGVLDDVRDALAGSLWYMRHEGGRYRFTTEPNLNKIIVEREGAVSDERIQQLLREAISAKALPLAPFRVETNVTETLDIADEPRLTLGVLNAELTADADGRTNAESILNNRGGSNRVNKNAIVIIAADRAGITRARQTARTVAAMQDITRDQTRLKRFNQEQRAQLDERLTDYTTRLPQQVVMAYRHLSVLGPDGGGGTRTDVVDLGPARVTDTITGRVIDHLAATDRLLSTSLAPAALLTDRFGIMGPDNDAVELEKLLGYFYRLPRLPKLAGPDVLRACLARGVADGLFGLAAGAAWYAPDAVRRFATAIDPTEIQFQPGTWLVRANAIKKLIDGHSPTGPPPPSGPEPPPAPGTTPGSPDTPPAEGQDAAQAPRTSGIVITTTQVPADKIRDIVKVAVTPLVSKGAEVTVTLEINASHPEGIPHDTLDLVVKEGLRQLGIDHEVKQ
jgi:hypothetical protein